MDHSLMKLGRRAVRTDSRTLRLSRYLLPDLPPPPYAIDGTGGIKDFGVMGNDDLGDCTIAACGHAIQIWTYPFGMQTVTDASIVKYYSEWTGYDPSDPSSDRGGIPTDVFGRWMKEPLEGHALRAWVDPDLKNPTHVRQAIQLTGGIYIGLELPMSAQKQDIWDVVLDDGGFWGGHAVYVAGYDPDGLTCITWGAPKRMTWAFWNKYCDEAHALFGADWTPTGIDIPTLTADLQKVSG